MLRTTAIIASLVLAHSLAACSSSNFAGGSVQPKSSKVLSKNKDTGPDSTEPASRSANNIDDQISIEIGETRPFDALPKGSLASDLGQLVHSEASDPSIVAVDPVTGDLTGLAVGSAVVTYTFAQGTTVKLIVTVTPAAIGTSTDSLASPGTGITTGTDPSTNTQTGTSTDGLSPEDKDIVDSLPGVEAIRVGVNFEDMGTRGDKDFNDAVLCFEGLFKVEGSQVVSIRDQEVVGTTSSISGCSHSMEVEIIEPDGNTKSRVTFDSKAKVPVRMNFAVGSRLEVSLTATASSTSCDPGLRKSMHNAIDAIVAANVCRTVGK